MSKNYANEHPKNKKKNQDSNVKVAKYMAGDEYNKFLKDRYNEHKKEFKVRGLKPMSFDEFKKPFPKKVKDLRSK